jgi:hypothetical protein
MFSLMQVKGETVDDETKSGFLGIETAQYTQVTQNNPA